MYTIRADRGRGVLTVTCSDRLPTSEALRALSQAALLMEAGGGGLVLCDVTGVTHGPGGLLQVAAALNLRRAEHWRVAFVAGPGQRRLVQRMVRFSGLRKGVVVLGTAEDALAWLTAPAEVAARRMSNTELRHAEHLLATARAARQEPAAAPATSRTGTSTAA